MPVFPAHRALHTPLRPNGDTYRGVRRARGMRVGRHAERDLNQVPAREGSEGASGSKSVCVGVMDVRYVGYLDSCA